MKFIIKKFLLFLLSLFLMLFASFSFACSDAHSLCYAISDLKSDIFEGKDENYTITASYGFRENPFVKDGRVGEKHYSLKLRIKCADKEPSSYVVSMTHQGAEYKKTLSSAANSDDMTAIFEIENFSLKQFDVTLTKGSTPAIITLNSIVPTDTLPYSDALLLLQKNQKDLIDNYFIDSVFSAEIYMRVIVKDGKSYWYVGFATQQDLKALLVSGDTGEVLAIRNVF